MSRRLCISILAAAAILAMTGIARAETPADSAAPAAAVQKADVQNPYGLDAIWRDGDIVSRGTLLVLCILSLGTWYIIVTKAFEQSRVLAAAKAANQGFWSAGSAQEGIKTLKENSPFRYIAESGVNATQHHEGTLVEQIDLNTWVTMSIQRAVEQIQSRLQGGLAFLATVGSTAPFVGLFGTVMGIYHALIAIGIAGQASIDKVAGPVGEALIMTAIGLATAVPAVLGYNWLVRRNKAAMEKVKNFSSDLHSVLLSGTRLREIKAAVRSA
jgi:biopolymer transport protein ExbB